MWCLIFENIESVHLTISFACWQTVLNCVTVFLMITRLFSTKWVQ